MESSFEGPLDDRILGGIDLGHHILLLDTPSGILDGCSSDTVPLEAIMVHPIDRVLLVCQASDRVVAGPHHRAGDHSRNLSLRRGDGRRAMKVTQVPSPTSVLSPLLRHLEDVRLSK